MSTSNSGHRLDSSRPASLRLGFLRFGAFPFAFLFAFLIAFLIALASCFAVPQQASAAPAVGETFQKEITIGTGANSEQVECTFKVTGANTVAIGGGGFVGSNTGIGYD